TSQGVWPQNSPVHAVTLPRTTRQPFFLLPPGAREVLGCSAGWWGRHRLGLFQGLWCGGVAGLVGWWAGLLVALGTRNPRGCGGRQSALLVGGCRLIPSWAPGKPTRPNKELKTTKWTRKEAKRRGHRSCAARS
ncbi:hypothetical protein ANANG_G00046290, partial [Anguilla anguilla]